ncbi:uncharacterized protein VTP21DRAFT_5997 [Calcarisporiella thermophila]|uniref:uncharacterized protein n=1 Tax=Calcarisporiella thermophila TaxID=911321 RepID=UPI0037430C04
MPNPLKPLVVICGATGAQGGSVLNALLASQKYHLRALTRNPSSPTAKELASRDVEVKGCDFSNRKDLQNAFAGAYAVFAMTNYFDLVPSHSDPKSEEEQGKQMADVALEVGVQHYIWSSLEDIEKASNGKYKNVHHFINKARVEDYIKQTKLPYTAIKIAFYYENFVKFFPPQRAQNGQLVLSNPMRPNVKLPMISATYDVGPAVAEILEDRDQYLGKVLDLAGEAYTLVEIAEIMSRVSGQQVHYNYVPPEKLDQELPYIASDPNLYEAFGFHNDFGFFSGRDFKKSRMVRHRFLTFQEYLKKIGWTGPHP